MANILYYPQMSMYDKQTKELTPAADGNINMMRNTIHEWGKYFPNHKFYILLPSELKGKVKLPGIHLYYDNYVVSARINRFNFPMKEFIHLLKDIRIDLLLNDVIELTSNFQQMFNIEFGYKPKIISNIRHLDDVVNHYYMHRIVDGVIQSDAVTILSESMKVKLDKQLQLVSGGNVSARKVIVFEPSISQAEIEPYTYNTVIKHLDKPIITFPGRLAKGEERRTNWDKFAEAIHKLREKRQDFIVYFTDPNNAQNFYDEIDWIRTIQKDRGEFLNLLNNTDIIVSLMDVEGFGGISIREALLFGCLPIIPYAHEYKKMASGYSYNGYVDSPIDVDDLVDSLEWAIGKVKRLERSRHYQKEEFRQLGKQFTIEEQFKKLLPKIEELL